MLGGQSGARWTSVVCSRGFAAENHMHDGDDTGQQPRLSSMSRAASGVRLCRIHGKCRVWDGLEGFFGGNFFKKKKKKIINK